MGSTRLSVAVVVLVLGFATVPLHAAEPTTERITESAAIEFDVDQFRIRASAQPWDHSQRLRFGAQIRRIKNTPLFITGGARYERERREPYDLRRLGGEVGLGWEVDEATSVVTSYRLDRYNVFEVGGASASEFREVMGRSEVSTLGLAFQHDTRDRGGISTQGHRFRLGAGLASEALGGDYDFVRFEGDAALYYSPLRGRQPTGTWFDELVLAERFRTGIVEDFGGTDGVPFFERYFVGGAGTVRGQRSRWLTPRGSDDQFVGGDFEIMNNVEARIPLFPDDLDRRLWAATFFDMGRAYRDVSDIGDFGYAVGAGVRYRIDLWKFHTVARLDWAINLDDEGDNNSARFHATLGVPF